MMAMMATRQCYRTFNTYATNLKENKNKQAILNKGQANILLYHSL